MTLSIQVVVDDCVRSNLELNFPVSIGSSFENDIILGQKNIEPEHLKIELDEEDNINLILLHPISYLNEVTSSELILISNDYFEFNVSEVKFICLRKKQNIKNFEITSPISISSDEFSVVDKYKLTENDIAIKNRKNTYSFLYLMIFGFMSVIGLIALIFLYEKYASHTSYSCKYSICKKIYYDGNALYMKGVSLLFDESINKDVTSDQLILDYPGLFFDVKKENNIEIISGFVIARKSLRDLSANFKKFNLNVDLSKVLILNDLVSMVNEFSSQVSKVEFSNSKSSASIRLNSKISAKSVTFRQIEDLKLRLPKNVDILYDIEVDESSLNSAQNRELFISSTPSNDSGNIQSISIPSKEGVKLPKPCTIQLVDSIKFINLNPPYFISKNNSKYMLGSEVVDCGLITHIDVDKVILNLKGKETILMLH